MRSIFVNLPVRDVAAARAFFTAVGFQFCEDFGDPTCACLVVDVNAFVLLLAADRFRRYVDREPGDPARTEVVTAVSAASRAEVDAIVAAGGGGGRNGLAVVVPGERGVRRRLPRPRRARLGGGPRVGGVRAYVVPAPRPGQ